MGSSANPAPKADCPVPSPSLSLSSLTAFPVELTENLEYDDPGSIFTLPLSVSLLKPLPPFLPVLLMPNSTLTIEGVVAAPFLYDSSSLCNLSLAAIGDRCFSLPAHTIVATLILLPPSEQPSLFALQQPVQPSKPMLVVTLNGRSFSGLIDTGADVSVIRASEWPTSWPLVDTLSVQGVGGAQAAKVSTHWLSASTSHSSATAYLKPYVLPLHCNLWGRDLLSQLHASLHIP